MHHTFARRRTVLAVASLAITGLPVALIAQAPSRDAAVRKIPVTVFIAHASQAVAPETVARIELTLTPLDGGSSVLLTTDTAGKATATLEAGRYRVRSLGTVTIGGVEYSWDVESTVTTRYSSLAISLNPGNATRKLVAADSLTGAEGPVVINPSPTRAAQPRAAPVTRTALQPGDPGYKDPGISLLFGFLIPGGGHMYSGEIGNGLLAMGGTVLLAGLAIDSCANDCQSTQTTVSLVSLLVYGIYGLVDAPAAAKRTNKKGRVGLGLGPLDLRPTENGLGFSLPFP